MHRCISNIPRPTDYFLYGTDWYFLLENHCCLVLLQFGKVFANFHHIFTVYLCSVSSYWTAKVREIRICRKKRKWTGIYKPPCHLVITLSARYKIFSYFQMFLTRSEYDRGVNTFSPEGRLFQVEYAIEAIKLGSTAIGICTSEGVVLAVEKRITSPLMEPTTIEKIVEVDRHIACAVSGLMADSRYDFS